MENYSNIKAGNEIRIFLGNHMPQGHDYVNAKVERTTKCYIFANGMKFNRDGFQVGNCACAQISTEF